MARITATWPKHVWAKGVVNRSGKPVRVRVKRGRLNLSKEMAVITYTSPGLGITNPDTTPDAFTFTDQTGVTLSTVVTSAPITVTGISLSTTISISGTNNPEYQINSEPWTNVAGTVQDQDSVKVRHTSSAFNGIGIDTVLTIGGVSDTFTSITVGGVGAPVIAFADLVSAPQTGWSAALPNQGAVVTIWGRNFGTSGVRGANFVTCGGVSLTSDSDYFDTWALADNPIPWLDSITFQLNSTMTAGDQTISVTVDSIVSNTVPLRINTIGTIYFCSGDTGGTGTGTLIDPWTGAQAFVDASSPGDVCYFRGSGIYDTIMLGGSSLFEVSSATDPSGTAADPIAIVGYPSEDAYFDATTNGHPQNNKYCVRFQNPYWSVSKMRISALKRGSFMQADFCRTVGCDIIGATNIPSTGAGITHSGANGTKVLGNRLHGARSLNRLDHAIYFDGCQGTVASEAAYNYAYDCAFGRGPVFSENHFELRCGAGESMKSNLWHHNVCEGDNTINTSRSRGIYVFDVSWDLGETEPDPIVCYNNIFVRCGPAGGIRHQNGYMHSFYNTVFENSDETTHGAVSIQEMDTLGGILVNNAIHQESGSTQLTINYDTEHTPSMPDPPATGGFYIIDTNSSFNGAVPGANIDPNPITGDPLMSYTAGAYNPLTINTSSPLKAAAIANAAADAIVTNDFYLRPRPVSKSVGAVEVD